jgi:glycerol kinase
MLDRLSIRNFSSRLRKYLVLVGRMDVVMKSEYILAVDQSTSGTKGVLFNKAGKLVGRCNAMHRQYYPKPGWVEHDAEEIFDNTLKTIKGVITDTGISPDEVIALAISNQRETALVWDKITGRPVYHAVVWQCGRAREICQTLEQKGYGKMVKDKTGLVLSPYFSAAKLKWILDNVEGAREKADKGELLCGNMDAWLIWKLTGGKVHATDYSNASRTQLFNITDLDWDDELLEIFTIPRSMMPEIKSSDAIFGYTSCGGVLSKEIPITGVLGDSHAALFGQNCFEKGMAKTTYGTGSSIMMNIGDKNIRSKKGLVTSIAWGIDGKVEYVFEGNINFTGATIKWLVDDLQLISSSRESGEIASSISDNGGVYLVPAFTGLSAPYWDSNARAIITGMTMGTKKAHVVRAAEESIAYQIRDIIDIMVEEADINLKELRVDGGPTRDDFLMQFQADMLSCTVVRNKIEELSAAGAAYMAGMSVKLWADKEEISSLRKIDRVFQNTAKDEKCKQLYDGWKAAVNRALTGR